MTNCLLDGDVFSVSRPSQCDRKHRETDLWERNSADSRLRWDEKVTNIYKNVFKPTLNKCRSCRVCLALWSPKSRESVHEVEPTIWTQTWTSDRQKEKRAHSLFFLKVFCGNESEDDSEEFHSVLGWYDNDNDNDDDMIYKLEMTCVILFLC